MPVRALLKAFGPWAVVTLVMLFLLYGAIHLVNDQWRNNNKSVREAADSELKLLSSLVRNDLRQGDYQNADQTLKNWGASKPDILFLELRAKNGFVLSSYQRVITSNQLLKLETQIEYSYAGAAVLSYQKDISAIYLERRELVVLLGIAYIVVGVMLILLTRLLLLNHQETRKLQRQTEALQQTQQQLREERKLVEAFIANAAALVVVLDREGRIQQFNRACEQLTHFRFDEVVGQSVFNLLVPEDERTEVRERAFTAFINVPDMATAKFTNSWMTREGEHRLIDWSNSLLRDAHGETRFVISVGIDVTERRRTERELENYRLHLEELVRERTKTMQVALEQAENASKLKSEFLGRVSHELRTPLNAILGFTQLLEHEDLTPIQGDFVNEVMKASWHLLGLIDEVLDLTQIESGKLILSLEPVNIRELAGECVAMVIPMAVKTHIRVDNLINDDGVYVRADRVRLKEVLMNLLSNAIKYNRQRGSVTLDTMAAGNGRLRLRVADTGPGIHHDQQASLFEPFNRMGAEYTEIEGTGIGLTIARQLMELMGGQIGVDSIVGRGSVFWVECPLDSHTQSQPQSPLAAEAMEFVGGTQGKTLLYIEDNPANLQLIEYAMLRYPWLRMLTASDAETGIELARREVPDLILMDLNLPRMDGYSALAQLRQYPETRDIVVIALSAAAMPGEVERGLQAGFRYYLTKPVNLAELQAKIEQVFNEQGSA